MQNWATTSLLLSWTCLYEIRDDNKIKAVKNWSQPENALEVCQFLGLASYYRCYILILLHPFLEKAPFCWNEACEEAFSSLKDKLTHAPILSHPQLD